MFRPLVVASLVIGASLLTGGLVATGRNAPSPAQADRLPDGPGKAITVEVCGRCHEPNRVASLRLTREAWAAVIEDMVARGAPGSTDEQAQVLDYLATHFLGEAPRAINLNTAPAIDLESVVGLLRSEARAFIEYREKNGPCKTLDDLKKVPEVDFKKFEAAKDRAGCF